MSARSQVFRCNTIPFLSGLATVRKAFSYLRRLQILDGKGGYCYSPLFLNRITIGSVAEPSLGKRENEPLVCKPGGSFLFSERLRFPLSHSFPLHH